MIVEGTYTFAGPRALVYDLLQDPEVLAIALPGAQALRLVGDGRFEGEMQVGIGPVTAATFQVAVTLQDQQPPARYAMHVEGKGAIGFTRGSATVELTEQGDETVMHYRADLKIGGKIAGLGQRVLDSASKAMTKQGLEAMNREIQRRLGGETTPAPARQGVGSITVAVAIVIAVAVLLWWVAF